MTTPICTFLTHSQPQDCGDYRHRILWPATALGSYTSTVAIQMTHPDVLELITTTDVLIICMVVEEVLLEVINIRKDAGLPTIYEISDDFLAFPENTQLAPFYAQSKVRLQLISLAKSCDAVQYSSPKLRDKYNYINPVSIVFMNQVWEIPKRQVRPPNTPIRIGWTASGGHISDALELGEYLQAALQEIPASNYHLSAMTTQNVMTALCTSGLVADRHPTGSWQEYLSYLSSLDIGIAHLTDDDFAQGRSDGKYIEYASQGVVAVCKNSGTYQHTIKHEHNAFLYDSHEELAKTLQKIITTPNLLATIRQQAYQDLEDTRNHLVAAKNRLQFYASLQKNPSANENIGFIQLHDPIEEQLMVLMEEHNENPSKELIAQYQDIIKLRPTAYQAWNYLHVLFVQLGIYKKRALLEKRTKQLQALALNTAKQQLQAR